jgi:hypothetical protein
VLSGSQSQSYITTDGRYQKVFEVEVNLWPTVSRPVCRGVRRPSGTRDQFLFLLEISFRQLRLCYFLAPSLTRGRVCNLLYNCFWAFPEQSLLRRARSPYLYPPGTGWPSYNPGQWVPFLSPLTTRRAAVEVCCTTIIYPPLRPTKRKQMLADYSRQVESAQSSLVSHVVRIGYTSLPRHVQKLNVLRFFRCWTLQTNVCFLIKPGIVYTLTSVSCLVCNSLRDRSKYD